MESNTKTFHSKVDYPKLACRAHSLAYNLILWTQGNLKTFVFRHQCEYFKISIIMETNIKTSKILQLNFKDRRGEISKTHGCKTYMRNFQCILSTFNTNVSIFHVSKIMKSTIKMSKISRQFFKIHMNNFSIHIVGNFQNVCSSFNKEFWSLSRNI